MPKHRKIRRIEESYAFSGEDPEYGAIFMSSRSTRKECLRRELFGLPIGQAQFVKQVKAGMILFLFDFESRELYGVFHASSDGAINIEPNAFSSSGKQFPAQVKFTEKWRCRPLRESEFCHAICENYFTATKFNFGLSKVQVQRLLKLFSLKKLERSQKRKSADGNPTRKSERNLQNGAGDCDIRNRCARDSDGRVTSADGNPTRKSERNLQNGAGDCGFRNRCPREADGRVTSADGSPTRKSEHNILNGAGDCGFRNRCAREADGRVTSAADDPLGHRFAENCDFGDNNGLEYDTTQSIKYSGDTSGVCRRLIDDPKRHGLKDRLGNDFRINNSFGTDASDMYSDYDLVNNRRIPKNLRHTASGLSESEYHDRYGITQASSWSNHKEHISSEANLVVPAHSTVPLESPYVANTECYDPCNPGIMADGAKKSSRHDFGVPNVDSMGSASFTANSNYVLKEDIIPNGGYVSDTLPSQTVKPYADEHNDTSINKTSSLGLDDYIPMPITYPEYQTSIGMYAVAPSGFESEYRNGHLHHSQFTGPFPSAGPTENASNFERLSDSSHNIFPSFAYPLSSRDLSTQDRFSNEIPLRQHQEEFGGRVSYSNNRVVWDSRIYPSFTYPSASGDEAELHPENVAQKDTFDSNSKVIRMKDRVSTGEPERRGTRKSVFSRLTMPSKECEAEKDTSPDTESVDEVMAFLNQCSKHWMEQKGSNMSNPQDFGKPKKKKEKILATKVLDNDLLDCEATMEHSAQKLPFIDFKRRSKAPKIQGNPTQGFQDSPEHSAPQNKKRKLLRPKLTEDDSGKDRGNNDNPNENVLASQSASEVPVNDLQT